MLDEDARTRRPDRERGVRERGAALDVMPERKD
jgi:hypothetical protein